MSLPTPSRRVVQLRRRPAAFAAAFLGLSLALVVIAPASVAAGTAGTGGTAGTAAASTPVTAHPAGKLTPRGCTEGAGTAACDLYAMTGSASILGNPINIWGFSTTGVAGSASAPGPQLVVKQGDTVKITLHNQLAGESVSLALPGQAPGSFTSTAGDDLTGVATGGARTYTFTATRPGTFAYEAGHTANGARQVAMGLAGALVVLATDNTAYGKAYDDDAIVVLSEIDPALNAAPATFDMRNFKPKYRLINGKPFPATDEINTDQGHTVLLRYVDVGAEMHAMSLLGADQMVISQDGHPMAFAAREVIQPMEPGATADTLVTMPSGPESKITLFDASEHLDNNAQTTADPLQFAFGGMLTFLDTAAPAPTTDAVGPVSSHITLSPNPSNGLAPVTVTADLSDATTGGSNVTQAEFVVDDAVTTGVGFATPMTATFGTVNVSGATGTLTTSALNALDAGKHTVFVRALDSAGNWGVVGSAILNLPKTGPQTTNGSLADSPASGTADVSISTTGDDTAAGGTITQAEYFLDTAGANGQGTALALNRSAAVVSEDATIPAATVKALGEGMHHVLVHSKDSLGIWGPPLDLELAVDLTGPGVDAASVGPNPTNGLLSDKGNPGYLLISAAITDKDAGGASQSNIVDAEAFLDTVGTSGNGLQLIAVDGKLDSSSESMYGVIPLSQITSLADGTHHVYVHGRDAAGNWGPLFATELKVDKTAPALGTLSASPNPTAGSATVTLSAPVQDASLISAAEFWFGAGDPGAGHGSSVPVSIVSGKVVVTVPLAGITAGAQPVNLRVQDLAGNWSKAVTVTVTVVPPNLIFADNFESGTLSAWSGATGGVSSTAAAAMGGSHRGLQVTLPGGRNNRVSHLTDASPLNETGYHAQFSFNRNTLTTGTNAATVLTLFDARNAANGQVFALQYHLTAGTAQVRTVLYRSGAGTLTGAWVTLPTGARTMRIDWTSGPATGTGAGSLRLSVDGVSRSLLTGNTSTLRIDTVRLGVIAGVTTTRTGSTAGTAYFDTFTSGRTTPQ